MLKGKLRSLVKVSVLVLGLTIMATAPVFADDDCDDDMPKLRRGVEAGAAKAQYSLGYCYFLGKGVQQDDSSAVKWFRKSAEQGFARGQGALGWMYMNGRGVPQDYREAVAWYRKGAAQGDAKSQVNLGVMYHNGWGVSQDYREAEAWYRKAAAQGNEDAINNLILLRKAQVEAARQAAQPKFYNGQRVQCMDWRGWFGGKYGWEGAVVGFDPSQRRYTVRLSYIKTFGDQGLPPGDCSEHYTLYDYHTNKTITVPEYCLESK